MSLQLELRSPVEVRSGPGVYPVHEEALPPGALAAGRYALQFASSLADLRAVQRLRFQVFNVELGEGLDSAYATGRDEDEFDALCHHLMVIDRESGAVVGTYRLMIEAMAHERGGFYSESEYDFADMPPEITHRGVEVGRACVHPAHRNGRVVLLLWRGLARYLEHNARRYLFGCCSLPTLDEAVAHQVMRDMREQGRTHPDFSLRALPMLRPEASALAAASEGAGTEAKLPALFQGYLKLGARVCSEPAVDRAFKVIDFFVVLDMQCMDPRVRRTFMSTSQWEPSCPA